MSILQVENVKYDYGGPDILKGISCNFELGKVHAILGKSGSGKTTLLSLLAGLDRPRTGEIYYDGAETRDMNLTKYRRENVAVIYQSFRLFPLMNVLENIMYPMELKGMKAKEALQNAKEYLTKVGLGQELGKRFPSMLSGGEQQRVAIARALATGSKVLLADEPTGNLDVANGNNIVEILRSLAHDNGYCVVIVTHDVQMLDRVDTVFHIVDGEIKVAS